MLRWFDGFEQYGALARMTEGVGGAAAWSQVDAVAGVGGIDGGFTLETSSPATGTYHLRLTDGENFSRRARHVFGVSKQVVGLGYRFKVTDLPAYEGVGTYDSALVLADIRDASNQSHFCIVLGTDGSVFARRGASFGSATFGGTLLGRSDPCVARGGYHHFELKTKIDNSVGYIEVRINEVTVLNLTGIDTQNTANAVAAQFCIGRSGWSSSNENPTGFGTFDVDDVFAWDDDATDSENTIVDFVGNKGVYRLAPTSDTATSDHTLNGSATAYGAIDEVPPSNTDYLSTASDTARTIVGVAPLPANVAEVIAMMPVLYGRKEESGSVLYRGGLVSGSDETYGPQDDLSTAYAFLRPGPKTIDPATGVAWANDAAPKLLIERLAP